MNIHLSKTVSAAETEKHKNIVYTQINKTILQKGKNLGFILFSNKTEERLETLSPKL